MDVCDKVANEDGGAKDAVASMIKRLAHRNANVQLYTLEVSIRTASIDCHLTESGHFKLAHALSQNCGPRMHRELASRAFTDALLRLASDRNTHQQVKTKILERMQEWADMFTDPDLGIMKDQCHRLKSQNPNLQPPSAPSKSRLTDLDRQKEEEELQLALRLSIQDRDDGAAEEVPSNGGGNGNTGSRVGTDAVPSLPTAQGQALSGGTNCRNGIKGQGTLRLPSDGNGRIDIPERGHHRCARVRIQGLVERPAARPHRYISRSTMWKSWRILHPRS